MTIRKNRESFTDLRGCRHHISDFRCTTNAMNIIATVIRRLLTVHIHAAHRHELVYRGLDVNVFSLDRFNDLMVLDDGT